MNFNKLTEATDKIVALDSEMTANKKTVYVATTDIRHGDTILEGVNVEMQNIYTGLPQVMYMTADDLGSTAITDITQGMSIMSTMVTPIQITTDMREYEIQVARLMQDQMENDYVDIRIMFPNGMDMLVLPKKQIKNLNLENCVFWTYLNEEEILRLSSATIDAFTVTGAKIYATRYVENNLQDAGKPTYIVNTAVLEQFDSTSSFYDENLLTKAIQTLNMSARLDMEAKLKNLTSEKLAAVASGHSMEDNAKNSALVGDGDYDAQAAQEAEDNGTSDMSGNRIYGAYNYTVSGDETTTEGEIEEIDLNEVPVDGEGTENIENPAP